MTTIIDRKSSIKPLDPAQEEAQLLNSSAASLPLITLPLHPRESLYTSNHKDYKSLVLTRLGHDSVRVNSLNTKFQLALQGVNRADLEPMQTEIRPKDLSTLVTFGISLGSGEYFTHVRVSSPTKQFYMVLDTGSDVSWVHIELLVARVIRKQSILYNNTLEIRSNPTQIRKLVPFHLR
ncbi:hypothetical protein ACLB2K_025738 [Fragaria x ananassa]